MPTRKSLLGTVGSLLMVTCYLLGPGPFAWGQSETKQTKTLKNNPEVLKAKRDFYFIELSKIDPKILQRPDSGSIRATFYSMADLADLPEEAARWRRELYLENPNLWFTSYLRKKEGWSGVTRFLLEEYCSPKNRFEEEYLKKLTNVQGQMAAEFEHPADLDPILLTSILLPEESRKGIEEYVKRNQKNLSQSEKGKAIRILVQKEQNWEEKLTDLDDLDKVLIVDKYKQYLYEKKISPTSREKPLIAIAAARSYLRLNDPKRAEKALDLAKKAETYPEFASTKAQALASLGKYEQATSLLSGLITKGEKSAKSSMIQEDIELLNHHLSNRGKLNPKFHDMLKALTSKQPESVLIRLTSLDRPDLAYQAFVRVHWPTDSMELVWLKDKKVLFAYRADNKGCASYLPENKVIKNSPGQGRVLDFKLNLDLVFNESSFHLNTKDFGDGVIRDFFANWFQILNNYKDNKLDLEQLCAEFNFLIDKAEGSQILLKPFNTLEKDNSILSMTLDRDSMPLRFTTKSLAVDFLAWDYRSCEQMIAAQWPIAPIEDVSELDPGDILQVVNRILKSYIEIDRETEKSTKPAGEK